MPSYRVSKSTSTATATSVSVSGGSQPESAIKGHHQGSFVGLPTTVHTPESSHIPVAEQPFVRLRLLAEVSTSKADPFEALARHRPLTFDDEDQEQSASSLSLPEGPSEAADDANPIMVEEPEPRSGQNATDQNADPINKRIKYSGDETRPFKCGYEGCSKTYLSQRALNRHAIIHTSDENRPFKCCYEGCGKTYLSMQALRRHAAIHSQIRCYTGDCTGNIRYSSLRSLNRHIQKQHRFRPYTCDICPKRYRRPEHLRRHQKLVHPTEKEQKPPKRKRQ